MSLCMVAVAQTTPNAGASIGRGTPPCIGPFGTAHHGRAASCDTASSVDYPTTDRAGESGRFVQQPPWKAGATARGLSCPVGRGVRGSARFGTRRSLCRSWSSATRGSRSRVSHAQSTPRGSAASPRFPPTTTSCFRRRGSTARRPWQRSSNDPAPWSSRQRSRLSRCAVLCPWRRRSPRWISCPMGESSPESAPAHRSATTTQSACRTRSAGSGSTKPSPSCARSCEATRHRRPAATTRLPDSQLAPAPRRPGGIPLWIGSWGSKAGLRRVARLGDGWLASAYNTTPDGFKAAKQSLSEQLHAHGRDPDRFPNALATMWTWVTEDARDSGPRAARGPGPDAQARSRCPARPAVHRTSGAMRGAALTLRASRL